MANGEWPFIFEMLLIIIQDLLQNLLFDVRVLKIRNFSNSWVSDSVENNIYLFIYLFIYVTFFKVGYTNKNTYVAMPATYIYTDIAN